MQAEVKKRKGKEGIVINLMLNKSLSLLEPCTLAEFVLICADEPCRKLRQSLVVDWSSVGRKGECFEAMR